MFNGLKRTGAGASRAGAIDAFKAEAGKTPATRTDAERGRLIFALDATMSRQPTWDLALDLQSRMFETAESLGGLDVQLVYFRGLRECRASPFVSGGAGLARYMRSIRVEGGNTQIGRVLKHTRDEASRARVGALVFVGDALEEQREALKITAGELALLGTKAFFFQEGRDAGVRTVFQEIAQITGGAYAAFDSRAPGVLAALLAAAAAYAAGGVTGLKALAARQANPEAARLLAQMR